MKPFRVNADYEVELFHGQLAPRAINETIEFFLFFLSNHPLYTQKTYTSEYLKHVQNLTHQKPLVVDSGPFDNFWGALNHKDIEKWWNSKITSTELILKKGWCGQTRILNSIQDISHLDWGQTYLLKDPFGMSGQKFLLLTLQMSEAQRRDVIVKSLSNGPQILEPKLDRKYDFSQYIFPDGKVIAYQNLVDDKFQYKGTSFTNFLSAQLSDLPFYHEVENDQWALFKQRTKEIVEYYSQYPNQTGYSIDSFVYLEEGKLKIRVMSEINYRYTMGRVTYELSKRYAPHHLWSKMVLFKSTKSVTPLWEKLKSFKDVMVLSPGDSRFDILFLSAADAKLGEKLLTDTQAAINLE